MIKLNNKNITYVALADSNNSIKAPKEIWYADSNNSVKLVYRRKDALIEGVDYEKYHWLKGDGLSWINTLKLIKSDSEVRCIIIPTSDDFTKWQYIYGNNPSDNEMTFMCVLLSNNYLHFRHKRGYVSYTTNIEYDFSHSIDSVEVNDEILPSVSESDFQESNTPLCLFNATSSQNTYTSGLLFDGYIKYIILSDELHLVPCKLLKPVPKWLDANGIRRQVGECGMIDLVSGKFYGNVNSVGTFTVENYYERKEWLQGDGSAYIDTLVSDLTNVDFIRCHYSCTGVIVDNRMFGREGALIASSIRIDGLKVWTNANYSFILNHNKENDYIEIDLKNRIASTSLQSCNFEPITNLIGIKLYLFKDNGFNLFFPYKIKKFDIGDNLNLIPCTLTMDLPASMDANNIARTKGTSGMWDLVSDKFYGNVASSGTFKAVNLVEGVDYEVHDILKTLAENTSSAPYDVAYFRFPNYISLIGKVLTLKLGNVYRDYNLWGNIVDNARYYILIYRAGLITTIQERLGNTVLNSVSNSSSTVEIDFDNNVVSVGTSTMNIQGTGYYTFGENNVSWGTEKYLKGLTISDVLNLIPVKLLKSIPSKYDANGIERQAGECGMYDTVNDVFYGNVASSGTFSVSDD